MKWLQIYLFLIFGLVLVFNVNTNAKISVPDEDLYINSPELSKLEKVKNIKNKKDKEYLNDALLTSIAGISAAMKNTG